MWVTEGSLKFSFGNIGNHLVLSSCLLRPTYNHSHKLLASGSSEIQEAQLSLRDRATRACQLKSGKVLHKCRRLVFEKL